MNKSRIYAWSVVALLWVVALLNYMDRQMLSTMRPTMQVDISELRSAENYGYLMAIFLWIYGCVSPIAGWVADRLNRKWLITASLFIWSGVTMAMAYATTFRELYWLRATMGVSEALYIPAALSLIADYHPPRTRSLAIGVHLTGIYLGQALGGFGATVAAAFSWQMTFRWFGWAGVAYSVVLILLLREKRETAPENPGQSPATAPGNPTKLFGSGSFWVILLSFTIVSLPGWAVKNWLPTLIAQHTALDMSRAGPLTTISIAASSLAGVLIGGRLSDRWVTKTSRGRVYISCIGMVLTVPTVLLIGWGHAAAVLVAAMWCFGLGYGMIDVNFMPILTQVVDSRRRATGYGLMNMTGILAGAVVTGLLGRSADAGHLGSVFAELAGLVVLAATVQYFFLRPARADMT